MENNCKTLGKTHSHYIFQHNTKLNIFRKQSQPENKLKKYNRLKTQADCDSSNFNVAKHFKYLKENHAHFNDMNYKNQCQVKNTYLKTQYEPISKKSRNSCPVVEKLERKLSLSKIELKMTKKKSQPTKKSDQVYWDVKTAINKMNHWKK